MGTAKAFDEDGVFCRTGHCVATSALDNALSPEPNCVNVKLVQETENLMDGKHASKRPLRMRSDWTVRKVPMRKFEMWRTAWGGICYTKKRNQAHKVYQGKYK